MKKTKILLALLLIVFLISSYCFATDTTNVNKEENLETVTLDATAEANTSTTGVTSTSTNSTSDSEIKKNDVYICEEKVNFTEVVDGNAFIIAKEATISGEIGGDLFIMAEKINIDGAYVYSNIFALGKEININGIVYDLYAACDTLNVKSSGYIYRDMRVAASSVNLAGKIRRNAYIDSKDITFDSTVGTIIYGDLNYSSDEAEFTAPEGAVSGEVKYKAENVNVETVSVGKVILNYVLDLLSTLATTLVIVLLMLWLAPKFIDKVGNMGVGKSFGALGVGILAPIVLIIVGIILLITTIGSQILFTGLFAYLFLSFIGFAIASIFFTKLLLNKTKIEGKFKFVLFTLLIASVLWLVEQLPFIGGLVAYLVWAFGTGTILLNLIPKKEGKAE